jgi:hypothetical protein
MTMRKITVSIMLVLALFAGGCGKSATSSAAGGTTTTAPASTDTNSGAAASTAGGAASSASASTGDGSTTDCPTSNTTSFAKTKFVAHAGLAFGVFHRYLYKPYRAGTFTSGGTRSKVLAFAKAGAAALFIKREVRLASEDVKANPTLCKVVAAPLASLGDSISGAVDKLKGGDVSGLTAANSAIAAVESGAQGSGTTITEDPNAKIG